ncbi:hypothetical protein CRG98_027478 [Punica granatum]|uniref:Uncharacterized protein n=1 Tax=Punica granatum TaxID=22663 RepID=A0A2I0J761_PUNGR|nr:hypothetical protein CRG98_027478 [Punica granatum]
MAGIPSWDSDRTSPPRTCRGGFLAEDWPTGGAHSPTHAAHCFAAQWGSRIHRAPAPPKAHGAVGRRGKVY